VQVDTQRDERRRKELDKARVADQRGKFAAQIDTHVFGVEGLEGTVVRLMGTGSGWS